MSGPGRRERPLHRRPPARRLLEQGAQGA
jgi:hypothetical protein